MHLFHPRVRSRDADGARTCAGFDIACTVNFSAALLCVAGGILFFDEATTRPGAWLAQAGPVCFALNPTLRPAREPTLWRRGQVDALARRERD